MSVSFYTGAQQGFNVSNENAKIILRAAGVSRYRPASGKLLPAQVKRAVRVLRSDPDAHVRDTVVSSGEKGCRGHDMGVPVARIVRYADELEKLEGVVSYG